MKVIQKTTKNYLIEHNNKRVRIPSTLYQEFESGDISPEGLLDLGIPESVNWADFISVSIDEKDIESALHRHGIHTEDDLLHNPQKVSGAILSAVGLSGGKIYQMVKAAKQNYSRGK